MNVSMQGAVQYELVIKLGTMTGRFPKDTIDWLTLLLDMLIIIFIIHKKTMVRKNPNIFKMR